MTTSDRGVLYPGRLPTFTRIEPPGQVASLVRWFWIPEWDLAPGQVSRQELLPFPACNLVVEPGLVGLAGPATHGSARELAGAGWAVGALLRPAAVPAFTRAPAALQDRYVPVDLPDLHVAVTAQMTAAADADTRRHRAVAAFAEWLGGHVPEPDEPALLANRLAAVVEADPRLRGVVDLAARLHVSVRTVQRLAAGYVGLAPSEMLRRRRLQDAARTLRDQPAAPITEVAVGLGYADHAHLTGQFRATLGITPSAYRRSSGGRPDASGTGRSPGR